LDGEVFAMAGGSPEHAALAGRLAGLLSMGARSGMCEVFTSDLRVRVRETGLATYPDLTIVCGPWQRDPEDPHSVTNPALLVEVLSDSTAAYYRGEKLAHYQRIEALREVLLVVQDRARLELWRREADGGWALLVAHAGDKLTLATVPVTLDVDDLYQGLI
jgi:Uma2 family endonuclease